MTPAVGVGGISIRYAQSVSFNAASTFAYDNFNRANGSLGANWTNLQNAFSISSNQVAPDNAGIDVASYTGATFGNDQTARVTVTTMAGGGNGSGPCVRLQAGAASGYAGYIDGSNYEILKLTAGVESVINSGGLTVSAPAIVELSVVGTTLTLTVNGVVIRVSTDSTYSSGAPGIWTETSSTGRFDDFLAWS